MTATTATVETLTAEVRVLMVGNRQITLSVARQLDRTDFFVEGPSSIEPFGRVRTGRKCMNRHGVLVEPHLEIIGRSNRCEDRGSLIIFEVVEVREAEEPEDKEALREWQLLPIIVLAGLK